MPNQTQAGKAFEFALLQEAYSYLSQSTQTSVERNSSFEVTKSCFNLFNLSEQEKYSKAGKAAILHIVSLEPRLINSTSENDSLVLKIASDSQGISGDVRDVLFIRSSGNWEIGISAKNNHQAVKHSRLSNTIDFGDKWVGVSCSTEYFDSINPIFTELKELKNQSFMWRDLVDKEQRFYIPILNAFNMELQKLDNENPELVSVKLLEYLIGKNDFYKVIKRSHQTEVYGFNLHGSLNKSAGNIRPEHNVSRLKLPTRIIESRLSSTSAGTLIITFDKGWQISFRIHNASSRVEPSLKFDINLIGQPQSLYSHHIAW